MSLFRGGIYPKHSIISINNTKLTKEESYKNILKTNLCLGTRMADFFSELISRNVIKLFRIYAF